MVQVLLVKAVVGTIAKKYAKAKIIKDVSDFVLYKKVDKWDKVLSYIPGNAGKAVRWVKKYKKKTNQMLDKIAKNEKIIQRLKSGEKMGDRRKGGDARWSINKATTNIQRARRNRNRWVVQSIGKTISRKLLNKVPGKRIGMSVGNFAKAIHDGENWKTICKRASSVMFNLGERDLTHLFNTINYYGSLNLTVNQFWKRISTNHNSQYPIIGSSGGMKLRYMLRLKDKYQEQIFDREFFFYVSSPQTGNFEQNLHSYDPIKKEYSCPIRGWAGTRVKYYHFYDKIQLSNVLTICCNSTVDFGASMYHRYLYDETYSLKQIYWIRQDPHYNPDKYKK